MEEDKLREIVKEEMGKAIMKNIDSSLIFAYVKKLEEENENLKQAIKINQDLYETKCNKNKELEKRISDLEFSLMDMVLQFADENKNSINTMGLSALEIAFGELDFDNPMPIKEVHKRYKKLAQEYYKDLLGKEK